MRNLLAALAVAALSLLAPSPAAALHEGPPVSPEARAVFVAYGEGGTTCHVDLRKRTGFWMPAWGNGVKYAGETYCSAAVEQTAQATVAADGRYEALAAPFCSGVRTSCISEDHAFEVYNSTPLTYRISLRAPAGQGWIGDPTFCSGVGTDNLKCEFILNDPGAAVPWGDL